MPATCRGAKLKAQYNRVRTSVALQGNKLWENTIGVETQLGNNAIVEASLNAPTRGGGRKEARQEQARQLMEAAGYQATVTDMQGLLSLARAQGTAGGATRGACKICGGLGHLTKKCMNVVSGHKAANDDLDAPLAPAAAALPLLPDPDEISDLDSSDLSSSSSDDSSSDRSRHTSSSSDSDSQRKRKRKHKSRERSRDKDKHKKHKKSSKHSKKRKHKSKDKKEKRRRHD